MAKNISRSSAFKEKLALCKREEKAEVVLLLAQDKPLVRLLLAWEKIPVRRRRRFSDVPDGVSDHRNWEWLWENVSFSMEDLATVSGTSSELAEKNLAVLQGNRLIYPDGTLNKYAAQYLKTKVLGLFRVKNTVYPHSKKD